MNERTSKKLQRNSPSMTDNEKKRSTEDKSNPKKDSEKKFKTEGEKEKKKIDWDEEKEVLEKYLSQKHSLSKQKIRRIIEERAEKFINWDAYKAYFMKYQSEKLTENIKKKSNRKLSNASDEVKSLFDNEAKESGNYSSSDDEDDIDEGNESDKTNSEDEEDESLNSRKRKCEYSTLDESSPKKKDTPVLRWLRNGDKVSILNILLIIFQTWQF